MKFSTYLIALSIFVSTQTVFGSSADTLDLMGGISSGWGIGWYGEAWKQEGWCGDTLVPDMAMDTVTTSDTLWDCIISTPINDTVITTKQSFMVDSLTVTTTTIHAQIIVRDSLNDPIVDIINTYTTIVDSTIMRNCYEIDFISDTGGLDSGALYVNYYYKFRNSWAQLPIIWSNWAGIDSITVIPYKYLQVVYKGLLPVHRMKMEFIYGTWGPNADTMKTFLKLGDGVGILEASPSEWKTAIIEIPDSVTLPGITGLVFAIGNLPDVVSATSELVNLKVARVSLLANADIPVRHTVSRRAGQANRFYFTPSSAGNVALSIYSLKGELLSATSVKVEKGRQYSIRKFALENSGLKSAQIRMVKIRGAGVEVNQKIW
ncbi:MAG: hypothetical protein JW768_15400 [Chitinispirillaceae bacterium]|nr:hypothetical protein [Chitinispirillaceae bacterium]